MISQEVAEVASNWWADLLDKKHPNILESGGFKSPATLQAEKEYDEKTRKAKLPSKKQKSEFSSHLKEQIIATKYGTQFLDVTDKPCERLLKILNDLGIDPSLMPVKTAMSIRPDFITVRIGQTGDPIIIWSQSV